MKKLYKTIDLLSNLPDADRQYQSNFRAAECYPSESMISKAILLLYDCLYTLPSVRWALIGYAVIRSASLQIFEGRITGEQYRYP